MSPSPSSPSSSSPLLLFEKDQAFCFLAHGRDLGTPLVANDLCVCNTSRLACWRLPRTPQPKSLENSNAPQKYPLWPRSPSNSRILVGTICGFSICFSDVLFKIDSGYRRRLPSSECIDYPHFLHLSYFESSTCKEKVFATAAVSSNSGVSVGAMTLPPSYMLVRLPRRLLRKNTREIHRLIKHNELSGN